MYIFKGIWSVGIATKICNLNTTPGGNDSESWVYCSDGTMKHNNIDVYNGIEVPSEGDVVVTYMFLFS